MLKTKSQVIFTALIIYVVYIAGFHYYFELIDYDIFFYCAAALYAVSFSIWMAVQDYFSKSQANTLAKSSERHTAHKKTIKYKSNVSYAVLSLVVILLSLVPVSLILVSMLLNQREIYHISFIYQCLIFLVGYVITFITPYIYGIGKTHSIELGSRSNINNSGHKKGTSSSSEGVIDMSSWFNSWKEVGDVSPSPRVTEETMSAIRNAGAVFHKKSWVTQTSYNEAVKLVDKILIDSLGINAYKISPDAQLFNDLNATENDQKNIDNLIYQTLKERYDFRSFCEKTDFDRAIISTTTDKYTANSIEQILYTLYLQNPSSFTHPPKEPTTPIWDIVHTVGDWYDIVADVIHYYYHPIYKTDSEE